MKRTCRLPLKNAIRLSNFTYRDVERRRLAGASVIISRLLRGGLGLKVEHLLDILGVIQFSPGRFFAAAFPTSLAASPLEDRLGRMLEQLHGQANDPLQSKIAAPSGGGSGQDEIDEMVRASLRRLLTVDGGKPPGDGNVTR